MSKTALLIEVSASTPGVDTPYMDFRYYASVVKPEELRRAESRANATMRVVEAARKSIWARGIGESFYALEAAIAALDEREKEGK